MTTNYLRYYHLERYLFEDVHQRFQESGELSGFDFMSIVIWKANRAKSMVAKRLIRISKARDLDRACRQITRELSKAGEDKARLEVLMSKWQFRLPMATAILSVCWPDRFTVYDVRVCEELGDFDGLGNLTRMDRIWEGYIRFREAVRAAVPGVKSLRDADRYLWGRSAARQAAKDIKTGFRR